VSLFDGELDRPQSSSKTPPHGVAPPLAERMRPRSLEDYVGQEHLLGPGKPLRVQIERDDAGSMILWGPPGVGKTTLAKIIAETTKANFVEFSAVMSGIKEIKQVMASAEHAAEYRSRTILFVDEIHRFNKAQQDAFLPYVERGTIRLIGATTENPSFEIISALLSRCRVYVLQPLSEPQISTLLRKALEDKERGLGAMELNADDDALDLIAAYSSGDCRAAYNTLEVAAQLSDQSQKKIDKALAAEAVQQRVLMYDKSGEEHYNLISALHKSLRGSDPQAALYYLARMLVAGEEPLYVLRRLTRAAVEDIGMADPNALLQCLAAKEMYDFLGSPEGEIGIAQACLYLATAPKSNATYTAQKKAWRSAQETGSLMPPKHILNAPTKLMKNVGYGKGYAYDHDADEGFSGQNYWPEELEPQKFYQPTDRGFEAKVRERLEYWERRRKELQQSGEDAG